MTGKWGLENLLGIHFRSVTVMFLQSAIWVIKYLYHRICNKNHCLIEVPFSIGTSGSPNISRGNKSQDIFTLLFPAIEIEATLQTSLCIFLFIIDIEATLQTSVCIFLFIIDIEAILQTSVCIFLFIIDIEATFQTSV